MRAEANSRFSATATTARLVLVKRSLGTVRAPETRNAREVVSSIWLSIGVSTLSPVPGT